MKVHKSINVEVKSQITNKNKTEIQFSSDISLEYFYKKDFFF